jgi:DNA-damage-inducible protein D
MSENIFEQLKKINEHGQEYWPARELAKILDYSDYGNFENVIKKAMVACENSGQDIDNHFGDTTEMVDIGSNAKRDFPSFRLSRYACYLIMQNADAKKVIVAKAQTYFAIQTRRQETSDQLVEDNKRVFLREEMKEHNKNLASAAKSAGVTNYANFQDAGYMGLYGGLRQKDIKDRKRLSEKESILDHMGSEELAANLFRATQAEAKLKREGIRGQGAASNAHFEVGKKVRATIVELGGTMPEKLPSAEHIKESKKRIKGASKKKLK